MFSPIVELTFLQELQNFTKNICFDFKLAKKVAKKRCRINQLIFNSLQMTISKMAAQDRYYCISFDEASLSAGLSYNLIYDYIEAFEDLGGRRFYGQCN